MATIVVDIAHARIEQSTDIEQIKHERTQMAEQVAFLQIGDGNGEQNTSRPTSRKKGRVPAVKPAPIANKVPAAPKQRMVT